MPLLPRQSNTAVFTEQNHYGQARNLHAFLKVKDEGGTHETGINDYCLSEKFGSENL